MTTTLTITHAYNDNTNPNPNLNLKTIPYPYPNQKTLKLRAGGEAEDRSLLYPTGPSLTDPQITPKIADYVIFCRICLLNFGKTRKQLDTSNRMSNDKKQQQHFVCKRRDIFSELKIELFCFFLINIITPCITLP